MSKYKVGDTVYFRKMKLIVRDVCFNNFKQELLILSKNDFFIKGFVESHQVKPVIRIPS